jgi:hypothetical protein
MDTQDICKILSERCSFLKQSNLFLGGPKRLISSEIISLCEQLRTISKVQKYLLLKLS